MRQIPHASIRKWGTFEAIVAPMSFSTWCPHCNEKVTFATAAHIADRKRGCVSASASCPGCSHHVGVWSFGPDGKSAEVFMYPNTGEPRAPKNVASAISEPLYRSYVSTIDAYNTKNYVATAVCCRRTLEGLFQGLLPEDKRAQSLARAIEQVADSVDLAEPIRNLANVLRQGGNLGAHFNMEKEPDDRMALQMLTLLENLIEFLHVLPSEIKSLEQLLDRGALATGGHD
jgi:hypothetical protein